MAKLPKEKLEKVIDACIEASEKLHRIEITAKGLQNSIDEISAKLFFHYTDDDEQDNQS